MTRTLLLTALLTVLAATAAAPSTAEPLATAATLTLTATVYMVSTDASCPPGTPATTSCHLRSAQGEISGLGRVSQTYRYDGDAGPCSSTPGTVKILGYTTSFRVEGKGEIRFDVADAPCLTADETALRAPQAFTVTGGTGIYAGASGSGRIERAASFNTGGGGAAGSDTWIGTLVVPGLEFDLTPPTMSGATAKTVRAPKGAKNVRVTFKVTATDAVDGPVPVSCRPKSGSRFKVGKTTVQCQATDTSANSAKASFVVTVKRRP